MSKLPGYETTYEIIKAGDEGAPVVQKGCTVTVHATGVVKETGKKFWLGFSHFLHHLQRNSLDRSYKK